MLKPSSASRRGAEREALWADHPWTMMWEAFAPKRRDAGEHPVVAP